jgi:hypothetical protein
VVDTIERALPLSHNILQISKNKLVWKNEAQMELNCNVIYQVSREIKELQVEVLVTINMKLGDSVLHTSDNDLSHLAPFRVLSVKNL